MKFANKMHCLNNKSLSVTKATIKIEPIDCEIAINHLSEDDYHNNNNNNHHHHHHNSRHQQQQQQQHHQQQQEEIHHHQQQTTKILTHQSEHNNHVVNRNQHNHHHHNNNNNNNSHHQQQHHNNQQQHSQQQQQQQKVILSPRMEYYHQRSSSSNKHNNNSASLRDYQQIDDSSSTQSIVDSSRRRCRSPLGNNMPSNTPQIVITRASAAQCQQQQQQQSSGHHMPSSPSSSSSHTQQQHLQQVRVIRDGRLYEESRRRSISESPPLSQSSSTAIHNQHNQHNHHHNLPASENNLRILSVAAVAAAEEQAAAAAAAAALNSRKHLSSGGVSGCNNVNRHVNVISTNNTNSGQKLQTDTYNNNNNNNNSYINSSSGCSNIINNSVKSGPSSNCNNNAGNNANLFRTPVVSSSSNTSMRPPPPPPPPKIKNSTNVTASSATSSSPSSSTISSNQPSSTSMTNNNEEPSSSIPDLEFDGTTVLCRVCGDKASGFHYGVHSCEGCKGFFRRSIQQKIQYRPCTKNQQCSILRINRNRCQYCRLKKCIAVGMSRDAVRFGRVPKREKARILAAMQQSTQNRGQQRQLATELDDQPRLLAAVLRAHMETCEFTKEKVTAMRQRARECPSYSMPTLLACPLNPAPELQSEQEFSERFAHVIRGVIDFAGMIPGFQLLNQDDKFTLLKAGLFDALFVRLICMFDSSINSIICLNGQVMRRDAIQNGANARFLVDSTFNFAERMNSMNLTDAEIGLFCAIVLITPDRPGLRNIELIDKMYSRLKGCLQSIINQNRPDQPDFMSELLKTMPDLRTLSTLHTEKLVVFRTEHKELLRQQMWQIDDDQPSKSPGSSWDDRDRLIDDVAKSPLGSVSSTESGDIEYSHHHHHHNNHNQNHHPHHQQSAQGTTSSLASSAPLLAATLSGVCPLRHRANSGSSAEDVDIVVGSHAHLTQNGLTITPVARSSTLSSSSSSSSTTTTTSSASQLLHHHLNGQRHPYRKLDSPTDSGIESGNEKAESTKTVSSGGGSSCSSPRSCVDDAMDAEAQPAQSHNNGNNQMHQHQHQHHQQNSTSTTINGATKRQIVEDMPVLKRVLQAPPLYDTNSLMDEAYKPHKKFRALRHRDYDAAEADATTSSSSTVVTPSSQSPVLGNSSNSCSSQINIQQIQQQQQQQQNHQNNHQQSQLHMHLTRNTNTTTTINNNNNNINNNYHNHHNNNSQTQQQHQHSSLSSTHSVLAKSLMGEPRMTPEQMKRSDIIQNYIMRDQPSSPHVNSSSSNNNGLLVCAAASSNSSPCPYSPPTIILPSASSSSSSSSSNSSSSSSSSSTTNNSNCASPSTTTVTLSSPPPQQQQPPSSVTQQPPHSMRWQGHSVITTTTLRQQSISPHSNSSTTSCNSNISNNNNNNNNSNPSNSNSNYFQAPHSTSVSPPRQSPTTAHSPPLLELQVDIADSQQPLNLSKKSPTPPPPQTPIVIGAQKSGHNKYPIIAPDVTVTPSNGQSAASLATVQNGGNVVTGTTTIHKVLLEA